MNDKMDDRGEGEKSYVEPLGSDPSEVARSRKDPGNARPHHRIPPWSWPILASAVAWAVLTVAIPPGRQDFPIGDDWAFAHGAIWFAQGQGIHYSRWASMPQLGQWFFSLPFIMVMGPSHFALRISTIILSWLGIASFYDLLRREGLPSRLAAFTSCALAMNPLFFVSQGTYMTDVPALAFGLMALNGYSRAMAQRSLRWLAVAVVVAVLGGLTRQTLIIVPTVAGLMLLRLPELRLKPIWLLSVIVPVMIDVATSLWFAHRPDVLPMNPTIHSTEQVAFLLFLAIHLCGLTVLPLCLLQLRPCSWPVFAMAFAALLFVGFYWFLFGEGLPYGGLFPYCTGMLSPWGTYSGTLMVGDREVLLTPALRMVISILGCLGGAAILDSAVDALRAKSAPGPLMLFTILQTVVLVFIPVMYDRYLKVVFPGVACLVAVRRAETNLHWAAGITAVALYGLVSVGLVHDWFSWNSARWALGRQAVAQGIAPTDIEGGFEWNGWFGCADPERPLSSPNFGARLHDNSTLALPFSRVFFPQVTGRFALAFTLPPNSSVVASNRYSLWLSSSPKELLFVRYLDPGEPQPEQ